MWITWFYLRSILLACLAAVIWTAKVADGFEYGSSSKPAYGPIGERLKVEHYNRTGRQRNTGHSERLVHPGSVGHHPPQNVTFFYRVNGTVGEMTHRGEPSATDWKHHRTQFQERHAEHPRRRPSKVRQPIVNNRRPWPDGDKNNYLDRSNRPEHQSSNRDSQQYIVRRDNASSGWQGGRERHGKPEHEEELRPNQEDRTGYEDEERDIHESEHGKENSDYGYGRQEGPSRKNHQCADNTRTLRKCIAKMARWYADWHQATNKPWSQWSSYMWSSMFLHDKEDKSPEKTIMHRCRMILRAPSHLYHHQHHFPCSSNNHRTTTTTTASTMASASTDPNTPSTGSTKDGDHGRNTTASTMASASTDPNTPSTGSTKGGDHGKNTTASTMASASTDPNTPSTGSTKGGDHGKNTTASTMASTYTDDTTQSTGNTKGGDHGKTTTNSMSSTDAHAHSTKSIATSDDPPDATASSAAVTSASTKASPTTDHHSAASSTDRHGMPPVSQGPHPPKAHEDIVSD